jgi:hypothetical protein
MFQIIIRASVTLISDPRRLADLRALVEVRGLSDSCRRLGCAMPAPPTARKKFLGADGQRSKL